MSASTSNTGSDGRIIAAKIANATSPSIRPWLLALSSFRLPEASRVPHQDRLA
jgi:hypothetical protein